MTERGGNASNREPLLRRLRRIEGQVRGVARMVDEDRYCIDVLTQISAIQGALDRVALGLVSDHTKACVIGATGENQEERMEELLQALDRLVSKR